MRRQIDAHKVALAVEFLDVAPRLGVGHGRRGNQHLVGIAEKRGLRLFLPCLIELAVAHEAFEESGFAVGGEKCLARQSETVETAAQRQTFKRFFVHRAVVHALCEVENRLERTVFLALVDDGLCHIVTHALDSCQSEANFALLVHTKLLVTFVHVGAERGDSHLLALVHQLRDFGDFVAPTAHDGSHELRRIVGFHVGCLVRHPRIASGVRLVEGILGKFLPFAPDFLQNFLVVAVFLAAVDEFRLHLIDEGLYLLTHRLSQGVAFASGEVGQFSRQQHHLFLIDGDAVGVFQKFLHHGNVVFDFLLTVFSGDETGNFIHRTGSVECVHGNEVLENCRFQFAKIFLHSGRFKLESADGASLLIEFEGFGIVHRNVVEVDVDAVPLFDDGASFFQLRQRFQTQKIHLDESCLLDDVAVVLRAIGFCVLEVGIGSGRERHPVGNRVFADDESAGVDARSAHCSFEHFRVFDGVAQLLVA